MEMTRIKLAALWTVVMFNMTFADIIGFMHPGTLQRMMDGNVGFTITSELLLLFSVLTAVPIVMIFLSLVLPVKTNRWSNTLAVILTTLFVVGAGSATYSYFFFAALELVSMLAVLWYAWRELDKSVNRQPAQTLKNVA
jgi:Sec-independent protein secretion pathway component TatC